MTTIAIIDYGMGNIGSVANALDRLGATSLVTSSPEEVGRAQGIILPGVGAYHAAMDNLRARGLDRALTTEVIDRRKPFLGICLGMQLLARDSTELGTSPGLGWIDGHVVRLAPSGRQPVPHVGWNNIRLQSPHPLFADIEPEANFFFDHSYHLRCAPALVTATAEYGGEWAVAVQHQNILGVQFHPEKSQRNGLRLLRNFLRLTEAANSAP